MNRSANFRLRGALGMLARVRHAACHRAPTSASYDRTDGEVAIAPTSVSRDRTDMRQFDRTDTR